ncbi:MAG: hypothetical protein EA382_15780 [Spirochaetaceae bacterium]|nr:MAG: hypothetical protein EA382_15780 [Spirochaetaceae bacterium]
MPEDVLFVLGSCSQKRTLLFAEHLRNEVLLDLPHRQFVFTMPKALRPFFRHDRSVPTPRDPAPGGERAPV